jgi:hypothetical protein
MDKEAERKRDAQAVCGVFVRVGVTDKDDVGRGIGLTEAVKLAIPDMNSHSRIILDSQLKGSTRFQDRYSSS